MKCSYSLLLSACFLCCLAACKKKVGVNQNLNPAYQVDYDFMPNKPGNWWRYGSRSGIMYDRYARNLDTMKLGLKYSYFERKDDSSVGFDPEYFGKNNDYYLTLIDLDGNRENYLNYVFWKDSSGLGTSWTNTGDVQSPVGKVSITIESYVAETGLTLVHGSKIFTNVTHVHSDAKAGLFGTRLGNLDIWFIKGTGIVREEAHINILNQFVMDQTDSLVDYNLVP